MTKRIAKKSDETNKDNEEAIKPIPKKVVTSKSSKTGAKNTAPKRERPNEITVKQPEIKAKVIKREPVKRTPKKEVSKIEVTKNVPVSERIGPAKTKRMAEDKYIRVASDADIEKFKEMSQRIQSGSIQWAYFAVDGDKTYHYYLVLKK